MKLPPFEYACPTTLPEAVQLLASRDEAKPLAGGQSLVPMLAFRLAQPTLLVDLRKLNDLRGIMITEAGVSTTGAAAISEQGQAQSLVNLYNWFLAQPDVRALFIHSLFERWTDPSSPEVGFGLIHQGSTLQPKPAFYALQLAACGNTVSQPIPAPQPSQPPHPAASPPAARAKASSPAGGLSPAKKNRAPRLLDF